MLVTSTASVNSIADFLVALRSMTRQIVERTTLSRWVFDMKQSLPALNTLNPAQEWAPWEPKADQPWSAKWAAHLYRRFAFGHTRGDLRQAVECGMNKTVEQLLTLREAPPVTKQDATLTTPQLRAEWVQRMLTGPDQAREKLALFWHNHFATSVAKVQSPQLMLQQHRTIARHALGSFRQLLAAISHDPAMLIWLDSQQNVVGKPNENFAREVMELFTLGVGQYTEADIREAARAFTGWQVKDGDFVFNSADHDDRDKQIFGKRGNFNGDDVLKMLLNKPACALYIVRKLYREFVNEQQTPSDDFLKPLADAFRNSDYDIRVPVAMIATSRHFYSPYAYRQKIKSPVEYVVGVAKLLGVGVTGKILISSFSLLGGLELMGQNLYAPPNVKGWEGGHAWLSTAAVLARHNFANALINGGAELNDYAKRYNPTGFYPVANPLVMALRNGITEAKAMVDHLANMLLPDDCRAEVKQKLVQHIGDADPQTEAFLQKCRDAVYVLVTLPEYQLN